MGLSEYGNLLDRKIDGFDVRNIVLIDPLKKIVRVVIVIVIYPRYI